MLIVANLAQVPGNAVAYTVTQGGVVVYLPGDMLPAIYSPQASSDLTELSALINDARRGTVYLEPRIYAIDAALDTALTGVEIVGVPGLTKIIRTNGHEVIRLRDATGVRIAGVAFESASTSAVENTGSGVVYSWRNAIQDVEFRRCRFTASAGNNNGPSFYTRTSANDTGGGFINGLRFIENDFIGFGRVGCTVMNRRVGSGDDEIARNVEFLRNRFADGGLSGSYGIGLSLDGTGSGCTVEGNQFSNWGIPGGALVGIGVENTGWVKSDFIGNRFYGFLPGKPWSPMSFSPHAGRRMRRNRIERNATLQLANARCTFVGMEDSDFQGNTFEAGDEDFAFHIRDSVECRIVRDFYSSRASLCALVGADGVNTSKIDFVGAVFDCGAGQSGGFTLRFTGVGTTANRLNGGRAIKPPAGAHFELSSGATASAYSIDGLETV